MEVAADEATSAGEKRHNGIPVLAASIILVGSSIGWQLMGAGVVVHFVVLMLGVLLGVLLQKHSPHHAPASHAAAAAAVAPGGASRGAADDAAGNIAPASSYDSGPTASAADGEESIVPSSGGGGGGGGSSTGATASPLHWVGETVEGSINWLRGSNNTGGQRATAVAGEQSGWASSVGGRRRSRSTSILSNAAAGTVAADTPVTRSAATSPTPDALLRRSGAEGPPPLGAGIPQWQPNARSRVWSRTFGAGTQATAAAAGQGLGLDAYDGDDSVEDEGDGTDESSRLRGSAGADWLVGAGLGDTRYGE